MGQSVPLVKDNVSHAMRRPWPHNFAMLISPTQKQFEDSLRERTRQLRGVRTQEEMAELLGVGFEAYKKYETRSPLPQHLLPKFAMIVGCDLEYLLTGKLAPKAGKRRARAADEMLSDDITGLREIGPSSAKPLQRRAKK